MEIEIGDYVQDPDGFVGILDNIFTDSYGALTYTIIDENDSDDFWYTKEVKLIKRTR